MRTLVIDTATAACSVALLDDGAVADWRHEIVGRGHAERLVPMIVELTDGGRADAILADCGPGSFTGIRVGLAAAIGLGIGWGVPVSGYTSTAIVAAAEFAASPTVCPPLAVILEGGHGEVFFQTYYPDPLRADAELASLTPVAARTKLGGMHAVGDGLRWLGFGDPATAPRGRLPDARDARLLPPALTSLPPRPIYGRAPDAKPNP